METFEVKRGLVKQVNADGGLTALANNYFENVESSEDGGGVRCQRRGGSHHGDGGVVRVH